MNSDQKDLAVIIVGPDTLTFEGHIERGVKSAKEQADRLAGSAQRRVVGEPAVELLEGAKIEGTLLPDHLVAVRFTWATERTSNEEQS